MGSTRWICVIAVVATAAALAACTAGTSRPAPPTTSRSAAGLPGPGPATGPTAKPVLCNGTAGRDLVTGLLADLTAGRRADVATYFSPPVAFVRWWDPTAPEVITFMPGPTDNSVTLDGLQAHLDDLAHGGFAGRIVGFVDQGYAGTQTVNEAGGWFSFTLRGHATQAGANADGDGKGAVDCASRKLKILVVDGW